MKKMLSTLIISFIFALVTVGAITFLTKVQTPEEKNTLREKADNIALNCSGQGLSMPFVPTNKDEKIRFVIFCKVDNTDKSCTMFVSIYSEKEHKHMTVKYPCQVQDEVIYSVGIDYAKVSTFSVAEYLILGAIAFLLCYTLITTVKVAK